MQVPNRKSLSQISNILNSPKVRILFNRVDIQGKEIDYIHQAIASGHVSGDGSFTKRCCDILESELGVRKALLTTSCTHALEMAAILLDIGPGDEVVVPSFTFVSTVNAFVLRGANPIFIDIRNDTLNMDEELLEDVISERTKAIVPVHYAGVGCEMERIIEVGAKYNIPVVEDNAHGLFGTFKGKKLGTFGVMSTQSFHETKNFSCGEGGALLINDPKYVERAEIIREKGTNRCCFCRGEVDKYTWVDVGSSYILSDILSAFLCAQLEERKEIQIKRKIIWDCYFNNLEDWAGQNDVKLPFVPTYCDQSYHMFYLIMPSLSHRQALIDYLKSLGILSVFHYIPLHCSEMGRRYGFKKGDFEVSETVSDCLIRLPLYNNLSRDDQMSVINAVKNFKVREEKCPTLASLPKNPTPF